MDDLRCEGWPFFLDTVALGDFGGLYLLDVLLSTARAILEVTKTIFILLSNLVRGYEPCSFFVGFELLEDEIGAFIAGIGDELISFIDRPDGIEFFHDLRKYSLARSHISRKVNTFHGCRVEPIGYPLGDLSRFFIAHILECIELTVSIDIDLLKLNRHTDLIADIKGLLCDPTRRTHEVGDFFSLGDRSVETLLDLRGVFRATATIISEEIRIHTRSDERSSSCEPEDDIPWRDHI